MRLALIGLICAIPSLAQFRFIEITYQGIGCASCIESMPERLKRLRGVETVDVDAGKSVITMRLATRNRVRLEQVRDLIEQDGTKCAKAGVDILGQVSETGGKWQLAPSGLGTQYELESGGVAITAGEWVVSGEVASLHPTSQRLAIQVHRTVKPE